MAVARRIAPDEVPGADGDGRVDDEQLAVRRVRAHPGDATLTARGDQRTGGRRVAVGAVRVEHQADAQLRAQPRGRAPTDTTGPTS